MANEQYYEHRQLIRRGEDFADLYADTCARAEEDAPNNTSKVKFDTAIEQIGDDEMSEIRGFDRSRSGGFVNG
jgi:hypothetical protein